ncbi:pilus assembly PilX family protein [Aromatoleum bremense]|nr:hypothetical protein [Aromatoleum bremense]
MASMRGSAFQENITSNMNNKAISFMAAEAGATAFWQWLSSGPTQWQDLTWREGWQASIPTTASDTPNMGNFGYFWIDPDQVTWSTHAVTVTVSGFSKVPGGEALSETRMEAKFSAPGVHRAFRAGLVSDQDITVNGKASFTQKAGSKATWWGTFAVLAIR